MSDRPRYDAEAARRWNATAIAVPHGDMMCFIQPRAFEWTPQPDITAYELALCQGLLCGFKHPLKDRVGLGEAYDELPPEARRHLTEIRR